LDGTAGVDVLTLSLLPPTPASKATSPKPDDSKVDSKLREEAAAAVVDGNGRVMNVNPVGGGVGARARCMVGASAVAVQFDRDKC
jgi:hypothetical protein